MTNSLPPQNTTLMMASKKTDENSESSSAIEKSALSTTDESTLKPTIKDGQNIHSKPEISHKTKNKKSSFLKSQEKSFIQPPN